MNELRKLPRFIHQCMTIGEIPTSYKVSLTYEEQLMWFCRFLEQEVIPVVNNNSEAVQELQNYVENYFENLDVQEEINNKLEEMAEDGTLEEIIAEYINLKSLLCYDTVADMKNATNLTNGSYAKTLGFYSINDGGNATYKIRTITNEDVVDNSRIISLTNDNTLIAELMYNQFLNVKTFGAKGDGTTDDSTIIQNIIDIANIGDTIYFPNGTYLLKELSVDKRVNFIGENSVTIGNGGTTLLLAESNKNILSIEGTLSQRIVGLNIKNINFNGDYLETTTLLNIEYTQFINIEGCSFNNVNGSAIQFACSFEFGIYKSVFRRCGNETNAVIDFLNYTDSSPANNVNNAHIENNTFGLNSGNWVRCKDSSNVDVLWIKGNKFEWDNTPTWANENENAVLYLGQINKAFIKDNSFTNFLFANNKYTKIIDAVYGMGIVSIINNECYSCSGTFIKTNVPAILSKDNAFLNCLNFADIDATGSQTVHKCTQPIRRNTNGSIADNVNQLLNYIESTSIINVSKNTLESDSNSLNYTKQTILASANSRLGYFNIETLKSLNVTNVTLKIRARRKSSEGSNPSLIVYDGNNAYDGTGGRPVLAVAVTSTNWAWYNITLPVATLTAFTSDFNIRHNNIDSDCLIDGYIFHM